MLIGGRSGNAEAGNAVAVVAAAVAAAVALVALVALELVELDELTGRREERTAGGKRRDAAGATASAGCRAARC